MKFKNITKAYKISSIAEYNAIELRLGVLGIKPLSCNPKQEFTVDRRVFIHSSADNSHYYLHSEEATIYDIRCSTFENWCKECIEGYIPETTTLEPNQVTELSFESSSYEGILCSNSGESEKVVKILINRGFKGSSGGSLNIAIRHKQELNYWDSSSIESIKRNNKWMYAKDFINKYGMADTMGSLTISMQIPTPKFKVGDKVKICDSGKCNGSGFKYLNNSTYEAIKSAANRRQKIKDIIYDNIKKEHYYKLDWSIDGLIAEHALTLVNTTPEVSTTKNKVVYCINNIGASHLVMGEGYEVLYEDTHQYQILTSRGDKLIYDKNRFSDTSPITKEEYFAVNDVVQLISHKHAEYSSPIGTEALVVESFDTLVKVLIDGNGRYWNKGDIRKVCFTIPKEKSIHDSIQELKEFYIGTGVEVKYDEWLALDGKNTPYLSYISPTTKKEKAKPDMSLVKEKALIPINITKKTKKKPNFTLI